MKKCLQLAVIALLVVCWSSNGHGADVDFTTSLTLTSRTGLFAILYTTNENQQDDTDTGVVTTQLQVVPGLLLALSTGRTSFQAAYNLNLSNRIAQGEGRFSLNIYHNLGLSLNTHLSRTTTFDAAATASMGLLDYSSALQLYDVDAETISTPPSATELRFVDVMASAGVTKRLSRLSSGYLRGSYRTRLPIGYEEGVDPPFSKQHDSALRLGYTRQIYPRGTLTLETMGGLVLNIPGADFIPVQLSAGWRHTLSERSNLGLLAGVMMVYQLDIDAHELDDPEAYEDMEPLYWLPHINLSYQHRFNLKKRKTFSTEVSGGINAYFDYINASLREQWQLNIVGTLGLPSRWTITGRIMIYALYSLITPEPPPPEEGTIHVNEYPTSASLSLEATHSLTRHISLMMGVQTQARWSDPFDSEFRARAFEEFFFYIQISASKNHLE